MWRNKAVVTVVCKDLIWSAVNILCHFFHFTNSNWIKYGLSACLAVWVRRKPTDFIDVDSTSFQSFFFALARCVLVCIDVLTIHFHRNKKRSQWPPYEYVLAIRSDVCVWLALIELLCLSRPFRTWVAHLRLSSVTRCRVAVLILSLSHHVLS